MTHARLKDDAYYTPAKLARAMCARLAETIEPPSVVVEPSAGIGRFVTAAREQWPAARVIAVEPNIPATMEADRHERWVSSTWEDADVVPPDGPCLLVGNPPFSRAQEHVRLALDRLGHREAEEPQPRYLALLLRASFLASKRRIRELYLGAGGLRYVWHIAPRPSFAHGSTDSAEYAVLVWQACHRGGYEGDWLEWQR